MEASATTWRSSWREKKLCSFFGNSRRKRTPAAWPHTKHKHAAGRRVNSAPPLCNIPYFRPSPSALRSDQHDHIFSSLTANHIRSTSPTTRRVPGRLGLGLISEPREGCFDAWFAWTGEPITITHSANQCQLWSEGWKSVNKLWDYDVSQWARLPSPPSSPLTPPKLTSIPITSVHSWEKLSDTAALSARGSSEGASAPWSPSILLEYFVFSQTNGPQILNPSPRAGAWLPATSEVSVPRLFLDKVALDAPVKRSNIA